MPLSRDDRAFVTEMAKRLRDTPLLPGSPFYEPIYESLPADPIVMMADHIEFNRQLEGHSIRGLSGHRGIGKTTELYRLKETMEQRGYFTIYADALDYINPSEPVQIGPFLMTLAGAFSDYLDSANVGGSLIRESFWKRAWNFLTKTEVELKEIGIKGELGEGAKAGVDLKLALRTPSTLRQQIQQVLSARPGEFKKEVDTFFADGVKTIRDRYGQDKQILMIYDSLEQVRGTLETLQAVFTSVENLFSIHINMLRVPNLHVVYTMPPWLKLRQSAVAIPYTMLPTPHLWRNDALRPRSEVSCAKFYELIRLRLGESELATLFGADRAMRERLIDKLIDHCGGQFRDLLSLLRDVLVRGLSLTALPVPESVVDDAISSARNAMLPIAIEDARRLSEIGRRRDSALQTQDPEEVNRLTRFLDNRSVLYFTNDKDWYDTHPLIRNEIEAVLAASPVAPSG